MHRRLARCSPSGRDLKVRFLSADTIALASTVDANWHLWLGFVGVSIAVCFSPGAGAIQSMATGVTHGLLRGYWSILGLELGIVLQLCLVAVGLGAAVAESMLTFVIVKWLGVGYLGYLAVRQWRAAGHDLREQMGVVTERGRWSLLTRGFLVNATNPKALMFLLAVMPQFVVPAAPLLPQYGVIGSTFVAVDVVVMSVYAGLSKHLLRWLKTARQLMVLNRTISGLFVIAAVVLSLMRRTTSA
jgi:homoserine/homoserine lactone efflux protein